MSTIVKIDRLTKSYKDIDAVKDVSFTLEENKIYGMLGRNGAGKTTIMHLLTAQSFPTSGEIEVFGENPYENDRVLRRICFVKESQKYPNTFKVRDVLDVAGALFPNWDRSFALSLVEDFRLPLKRKVVKLSRGMLSAVGIIVGLASRAPLTIFDEPYLGLDAVARSLFYDRLLEDYAEHPRTIVLSTHLIDEVSRMLEHVILIDRGRLLLDEESEHLQGRAYTVVGSSDKIEAFGAGKRVLSREAMGGLTTITILSDSALEDRKQAQSLGLELAQVTLQQLIVHLTGNKNDRKEANVQ
ncbi:ABC transporter ATP-binding protein [Cohnella sp. REN36]|uniref:ABC transporter ATP-binding protein n=1 Tax=Cohnella sp. REN36 TaxID=2887347 RepID=UPI001D15C7D1|nr:ABC transporter ATP-binding protein [Cohnella sp. REN36]MCC3376099.1 ABC transporter ATP-binding protein [Cohnella sp. REN36]